MKRTKLAERILPDYTRGEEIFNSVSHAVGVLFGAVVLILCLCLSIQRHDTTATVCSSIYGVSIIFLYSMSTIYHALKPNLAKKVFQILDHCAIYILIAGSYTPILLCSVRKISPVAAWTIFAAVWGISALAIVLNAIDLDRYAIFSMICYIGLGWCIIFEIRNVFFALGKIGFALLLAGGIAYTIGAILYGIGSKIRYMHSAFHLFVLVGSILQFHSIYSYVI